MSSILDFFKQQQIQKDQFNYDKESRRIQMRGKAAQNLQDFRWGGEQKVAPGGILSGGLTSPLATLATIATNIAGAKLMSSTMKEREDLDKISNETFREGMDMLKNEGATEKDAREKIGELVDPEKAKTSFLLKATGRADGDMGPDNYNPARDVSAAYGPVATPEPVPTPAPVQPQPLARTPVLNSSAGGGRGGRGGPTAQELKDHASRFGGGRGVQGGPTEQQLPGNDMTVYPTNTPFKYEFGLGSRAVGPKNDVMGRDDLGVNRMTPQQMEDPAAREYKSDVADRNAPLWNITQMDAPNVMGRDDLGVNRQTPQQLEQHVGRARVGTELGRKSNPDVYAQTPLAVPNATPSPSFQSQTQPATSVDTSAYGPPESLVPRVGPVYDAAADEKYLKQSFENYVNDRQEQARVLARTSNAAKDARIEEARSVLRRSGTKGQTVDNMFDEKTVGAFFDDDRKNYIAVGDKIFNTRTKEFMGGSAPKERNLQAFKPGEMIYANGKWVEVPKGPSNAGNSGQREYAASWDSADGRVIAYKDGSTQLVGGRTPEAIQAADANAAKVSATEKANRAANIIVQSIGQVIANGDHEAATGIKGKVGSVLNAATGTSTEAAGARSRIDNLSNQMIPLIFAQLQEDKVSANKVADTMRELNALIASKANLDYNRLSGEQLKNEILKLQNNMLDIVQRKAYGVEALNTSQEVAPSGWTPTRK